MGWDQAQLGDFEQALVHCRQSLELHQQLDHRHGQADLWASLGYVYRHLGDYELAVSSYEQAVRRFGELGDRFD